MLPLPNPSPSGLTRRSACRVLAGLFVALAWGPSCRSAAPSTGNAHLDELRRLAVDAPIDELASRWLAFVDDYAHEYRDDVQLPRGMARLVEHVLEDHTLADRRVMALVLADVIERGESPLHSLRPRIEELRCVP